ncbi:hypothetical protein C6N75_19050 [Streptomyces solincola]|uniref:OmpR/PhoB-type domain-containing protein n=1 Tax=Streptomyces solincola TaxID=2100817 RepID=A0A2S9PTC8_9ACTN|nr:AfsR/SARP family transcriptional regulator [Streptomyces solincola]PRH77668.1 hypothetical protein C6N75_19050 [Streptomyces solincola]
MAGSTPEERGGQHPEFRLLGPVSVLDGRTGAEIVPPGAKQRALLAAFTVRAGRLLSVDELTEELWGSAPPAAAGNALQAHVGRLRRLLPPPPADGAAGGGWISTLPTGYKLSLGPCDTDARRFQRLSEQGRAAVAADPWQAVAVLERALALWRGPALQDSRYGPIGAREADRLEESRLTALETLYGARLRCAQHGEVVGELERLTTGHPLRERFYDLLMVALYRSGRQAEALGVYERARRSLLTALGVEPGPALRARLEAVLNHLPALACPDLPPRSAPATASTADAARAPAADELARLRRRLDALDREQASLARRFDALTAPAGLPAPT